NFTIGVIAMALGMTAFFGINVVYPLWLQTVANYTASWAGYATAPVGILAFLMAPIIGRNIQRLELRAVVTFSFCVFAATSYWFSTFPLDTSFWQFVLPRFLMGLAIPCFFIPLNQVILSGLKPNEIASASGLSNFFRTIAASISTAVTVTMWQHRGDFHHATLAEHLNNTNAATQQFVQGIGGAGATGAAPWAVIEGIVNREALTLAVNDVFLLYAVLFVIMIPIVWLAKPPFGNVGAGAAH
ncbi:MAG: MFS transporter, partial [Rhodanobacteraceae bacterium]